MFHCISWAKFEGWFKCLMTCFVVFAVSDSDLSNSVKNGILFLEDPIDRVRIFIFERKIIYDPVRAHPILLVNSDGIRTSLCWMPISCVTAKSKASESTTVKKLRMKPIVLDYLMWVSRIFRVIPHTLYSRENVKANATISDTEVIQVNWVTTDWCWKGRLMQVEKLKHHRSRLRVA